MKLEKQVDEHADELNKLKYELKHNETLVAEQTQTIQAILTERDTLNTLITSLTKEKSDLEISRDLQAQELLMSKDKLSAVEQCKEILRAQLAVYTFSPIMTSRTLTACLKSFEDIKFRVGGCQRQA
jgi:hypothetical protein